MKNTLNEILSMMNRIDPTYVSEDGDMRVGDEGQVTQGNMIGFVVDGITFFENKDINKQYEEPEDFFDAVRLINHLTMSPSVDENALNMVTSIQRPERGTLLYVIKYIIIGIKGNKTRIDKTSLNEGAENLSLSDFNAKNIELSRNINNYGDIMKTLLSSLMIDFLIDNYENVDNIAEKYNTFRRAVYELLDNISPDNENEIKFLFTFVKEYTDKPEVKKSFSNLIGTLMNPENSHREDTTFAFNFLKSCWRNMISFVNEWANKKNNTDDADYVYELSDAEKAALFGTPNSLTMKKGTLLLAIDTCVNSVCRSQGLYPSKNVCDNMLVVRQAIEDFYSRYEAEPNLAYSKIRNLTNKYNNVTSGYLSKIGSGAKILSKMGESVKPTADLLSNIVVSCDNTMGVFQNLLSNVERVVYGRAEIGETILRKEEVLENFDENFERLRNAVEAVKNNMEQIKNTLIDIFNGLSLKRGGRKNSEEKITFFNTMITDADFYYLTRGILGDFFKRIEGLEQEMGYNAIRYRKSNISVNNKMYHSTLRGMFGTEQYQNLRTYLYYVTNYENYSTKLRNFLYGGTHIYTPSTIKDALSVRGKTKAYIDDPMGMDNLSSEDMYREIINMFIKKLEGKKIGDQYKLISSVKSCVADIKLTGRGMMNSASLYDNIQDTLLFLVKNGDVQDRIRAGGMLEQGTMTLLRSLELVFSTMNEEYSVVSRKISPLDILLNKPIDMNNEESVNTLKNVFGVEDIDKIKESLPLNGLFVFGKQGNIMKKLTLVDLFAGSHRSFDYEDKDKTNAAVNAFCNEVVMNYVTDEMMKNPENKSRYEEIFNQLKFVRELNNKIPSPDLKTLLHHLSIDIGNERFKIAIEYQGEQHFVGEGRQSPLQENIRRDEFQNADRLWAYFERRDAYMNYISEKKGKTVKASLNRLSNNFLLGIVTEFKNALKKSNNDGYGIPINETEDSIEMWEKFLRLKNPDSEIDSEKILKKDLSFNRIGEVSAANSIARWKAEIDSWHQQLKDNTKIAKLCTTGDNSWMFVQLIPKKYADSYAKITKMKDKTTTFADLLDKFRIANMEDKTSKFVELLDKFRNDFNYSDEPDEKEKEKFTRDFTRYSIMLSYYGINGFKHYGYTTGTNKFDVGDFNRDSYKNLYVIPWPTPEGEDALRQLIIDRYNEKRAYETAAGKNTNNNPVKNNIVSINNVSPYSAAAENVPNETIPKKGVTAGIPKEAEASLFESIIRSLFE